MSDTPPTREEMEARALDLGLTIPAKIKDATLAKKIAGAEAALVADAQKAVAPEQAPQAKVPAVPADPKQEGGLVVEVIGPAQGRRRIGRRFTPEAQTIPLDDLSEDEKTALAGDKLLTIRTYALPKD